MPGCLLWEGACICVCLPFLFTPIPTKQLSLACSSTDGLGANLHTSPNLLFLPAPSDISLWPLSSFLQCCSCFHRDWIENHRLPEYPLSENSKWIAVANASKWSYSRFVCMMDVCVHIHVHSFKCMCMCCIRPRPEVDIKYLVQLFTLFLRQKSVTGPELTGVGRLDDQQTPRLWLSALPQEVGLQMQISAATHPALTRVLGIWIQSLMLI